MLQFECVAFEDLSLKQLYDLLALRQAVFVVEQYCAYQDADGKDAQALHVLGTTAEGRLGAYARLLPVGVSYPDHASIGRIITADFVRGSGQGRRLVRAGIDYLYQFYGPVPVKISAQAHLCRFYESFGFETVGRIYLEDGIPHLAMELS